MSARSFNAPMALTAADVADTQASTRLGHDAVRIADRVNQALDHDSLSLAARKNDTVDLHALQQLVLRYAEQTLHKADWIDLHRYVAQLAVAEGAQSPWRWRAMDLMGFALSDYLANRPDAGDALLRELVALTRRGATGWRHDGYHRARLNGCDTLPRAVCQSLMARRPRDA